MKFIGEFDFLSNFFPAPISISNTPGTTYPTSEHLYQALKTSNAAQHEEIRIARTPGQAKRLGQKVETRGDWEALKIIFMRGVLVAKFRQHPELQIRLAAIEGEIIEDNHWGDIFWGVCQGCGENHLGKLLMELRTRIQVEGSL